MTRSRSPAVLAVALLAALCVSARGPQAEPRPPVGPAPSVQVFFGPKAADDPQGLVANLLGFIDDARTSLHGCIHEVDMVVVAERLAARAAAGVDVAIVVESQWWFAPKVTAARQVLAKSKVRVIPDTKASGLMHNKFLVADGKRVWTGSVNFTETCLLYNPNNGIVLHDARIAANFAAEFAEEAEGRFGKKASGKNNTPHPTVTMSDGGVVETYFAPEDEPMTRLITAASTATTSIDVMCFVFSHEGLCDALAAAHKRGVRVRVLLDNAFSKPTITGRWKCVPAEVLKAAGVPVKYDDEQAKLHHKVMIVDGSAVVTGSFNFSASAALDNDENVLVLRHPGAVRSYKAEFERLWTFYGGDPGSAPDPEVGDDEQ